MTEIATLNIMGHAETLRAARDSFEALAAALENVASSVSNSLGEDRLGVFVLPDELSDLLVCEALDLSASGACELQGLKVAPSERYRELVAAVAGCVDGYAVRIVHGWPVLSPVVGSPTIAEAGGESIAPGGGLA